MVRYLFEVWDSCLNRVIVEMTIAQLGGPPVGPKLPGTSAQPTSNQQPTRNAKSIEDELSEDESVPAPRGRYGLRSKTTATQQPLAGPSGTAHGDDEQPRPGGRSNAGTKRKQPEREVIVIDESDEEVVAPVGKGKQRATRSRTRQKVVYKSAEVIGNESGDEVMKDAVVDQTEHVAEEPRIRPRFMTDRIYCSKVPEYWVQGGRQLSEGFLNYIGVIAAFGVGQQSVSLVILELSRKTYSHLAHR